MKKYIGIILLALFSLPLFAQVEIMGGYDNCGLYNKRTQKWVVSPQYRTAVKLGNYNGVTYFALKTIETDLWGIICSKDGYKNFLINPTFSNISAVQFNFASYPLICVQKQTSWGVLELYTDDHWYLFGGLKYQYVSESGGGTGLSFVEWNNNRTFKAWSEVRVALNQAIQWSKEKEEQKQKEKAEILAAEKARKEREAKEKSLASFTTYASQYIQPKINTWQQKGEFEKISAYSQRVTGTNRQNMIDSLTFIAEELFLQEHATMNYLQDLQIGLYDSESEVFPITCKKFGQLLIPVPIEEAAAFKASFKSVQAENIKYFVQNDQIALRSAEFVSPDGKRYKYINGNALNYTRYELNSDNLGLATINVRTGKSEVLSANSKPMVYILSPKQDGPAEYQQATYTFNIEVRSGAGTNPKLFVEINGGDRIELTPDQPALPKSLKKGVTAVQGKPYTLNLPVGDPGTICNVQFLAIDEQGLSSETQRCKLIYTGKKALPVLHVLAVGVGKYTSPDLSELKYPAKDAQDFVAAIQKADLSEYDHIATPILLTNGDATRQNILRTLNGLKKTVNSGDVVMVFFSGHGVREGEEDAYFMSVDSRADEPYSGVDFADIKKALRNLKEQHAKVVLFMDACYSGMMSMKGGRTVATIDDAEIIGFYSSTKSETSAEAKTVQNGYFTRALVEGLNGKAAKNGEITIESLRWYIVQEVKGRTNGQQNPICENINGDLKLFNTK